MMRPQPMSWIAIKAEAGDAYDGIIRLATDAQRFGFPLQSLGVEVRPDGSANICMVVGMDGSVDREQILQRFSRHPTVSAVERIETDSNA